VSANGDLSILSRCRRERFYFIGALLLVGGMASVWPTTGDELALSSPFFQIPVFLRVGVGLFLAAMAFYYAARARKAHIWVVLWFVLWPLGEVSSYLWVLAPVPRVGGARCSRDLRVPGTFHCLGPLSPLHPRLHVRK
jgi:hypothetical protein